MKRIIVLLVIFWFVLSIPGFAQTTLIAYVYDSAGNRTQRDTLATVAAVLPTMGVQCEVDTIYNPQYTAVYGEDVISSRGTSPKPIARHLLLEKIKPIKSHLLQKPSSGALKREAYE